MAAPLTSSTRNLLDALVTSQGLYEESSTKLHPLGTKISCGDRTFRYAKANEALTAGKLCTSVSTVETEDTVTVAHALGVEAVTVTFAGNRAADLFADGYLVVDEGTGLGDAYRIKGHKAINATTGVINLYDGLLTAWVLANTDVTLVTSPYLVQESNTDQIEAPAGVPLIDVTSAYYFWLQTEGVSPLLIDATGTFGNLASERLITISGAVAGAGAKYDAAGEPVVGRVLTDAADKDDPYYFPLYSIL